ncbi:MULTISPECIES: ABC transporter permease [Robinsoniella]|uniref:ABC transporter permease n=1 Tax=Robinsoniella TaxID=588605 RepID=UPI000488BA90
MKVGKKRFIKTTGRYMVRLVTLLIAISIISFILVSMSPVDPVQQYVGAVPNVSMEQREKIAQYWGLDKPPVERFGIWAKSLLQGDFGTSLIYRRPVLDIIGEKFAASLALMITAWLLSGIIGFSIGCVMGAFNGKWPDRILKKICLTMCAIPTFWIGIVLLMVFSAKLGWFPMGMSVPKGVPSDQVTIWQRLHHLILPALTLSFLSFANIALHTREKLTDVLESDYVLFAKAKGESRFCILKRHGLRNIMLPAVTMQFGSFSELFGGSVLAETVFSYPGLGAAASAAGMGSDIPLLLGITLFSAVFVFTGNLLANIIYGVVDPQIREGYQSEQ